MGVSALGSWTSMVWRSWNPPPLFQPSSHWWLLSPHRQWSGGRKKACAVVGGFCKAVRPPLGLTTNFAATSRAGLVGPHGRDRTSREGGGSAKSAITEALFSPHRRIRALGKKSSRTAGTVRAGRCAGQLGSCTSQHSGADKTFSAPTWARRAVTTVVTNTMLFLLGLKPGEEKKACGPRQRV